MKDEFSNEILLAKSMSLLKQLIIDINENMPLGFIPQNMEDTISQAVELVDNFYSPLYDLNKMKEIISKLHSEKELYQVY